MKISQGLRRLPLYTRFEDEFARIKENRIAQLIFWALVFFLAALIFGLAHTQTPLYEGNQNTKFLHGLAMTGQAHLEQDWLANTVDPLPAFSFLVYLTALVAERLFYVYYFILFGVYVLALVGIVNVVFPPNKDRTRPVILFGLLVIVHSIWIIKLYQERYGFDMTLVQYGLAGQYLLGEEFQNSSFGVLLLLSIWLFLKRKPVLAILSLATAAVFHSAYLFPSALIVSAYGLSMFWERISQVDASERRTWKAIRGAAIPAVRLGALALVLVLPVVLYQVFGVPSSDPETAHEALRILVHERIPHHALPSVFMGPGAYFQIGLIIVGILLAWRSRLGVILITLFVGGAALSAVQVLSGSDSLALLGPWRVSVLLVPIGSTLILAGAIHFILDRLPLGKLPIQWIILPIVIYYVFTAVNFGIDFQERMQKRRDTVRITTFMYHIRQAAQPGETYLIPPTEGEFNDFRMLAGVPILANWKSHPYLDTEILEWYRRVVIAEKFYAAPDDQKCSTLTQVLESYPQITHVVDVGKEKTLDCSFLSQEYEYYGYKLYGVSN